MKRIILLLAWRYLLGTKQEKSISTMLIISFLGILIGSFALALVISIMNGFEKITHEKIQGIHSQIIIKSYNDTLDFEKISAVLEQEFPEIKAFSPSATQQVIIQQEESDDISNVVIIKGIDPQRESLVSRLEKKITASIHKKTTLSETIHENDIIIGEKLAKLLDVFLGDHVNLLFTPDEYARKRRITLNSEKARISGTFNTGIDEFDTGLIICSLSFLEKLFPNTGVTQINIKLKPDIDEYAVIDKLKKRIQLDAHSWKDLYPALVAALKLEKYAMFFILALIILVASMNIISVLFMHITQKRGDIAILKAMGLADNHISTIFLIIGMSIALVGSCVGLIAAFIVGWLLERYPFITLPDAYYVTHLPIRMEWHLFALVFVTIMILSFIAIWIPTRRTRKINITEVLRFEA